MLVRNPRDVHDVRVCMWPLTRQRAPVLARKNIVDGNIQFELGHYHAPTMVSVHPACTPLLADAGALCRKSQGPGRCRGTL